MARFAQNLQPQVQVEDTYLIALAKQGSADAYDHLVRRYYSFVRLKASSYFLIGGDAEDLVQEGLVGLYKAIRDFRWDRESSFRNFAELCITRQIITAVKTATRNKHSPLNGYVSFSTTRAGGESEPTLDEVLPGPGTADPASQGTSRRAPCCTSRPCCNHGAMPTWLIIVLAVLGLLIVGGFFTNRRRLARTQGAFDARLQNVNRDLAAALAEDRG